MRAVSAPLALLLFAVSLVPAAATDIFARPVPAAGEESTTLLIYDTLNRPFSLVNEIAVITALLGRFQTKIESRQTDSVTSKDIESADYIIVAGVSSQPRLNEQARRALAAAKKPSAYLGWAAGQALPGAARAGELQSIGTAKLKYAGYQWDLGIDPFVAFGAVPARPLAEIIAPAPRRFLAWREGPKFAFASLPAPGTLSLVFSDLLLDFFEVKSPPAPALLYLVQDFHPGCDSSAFRRLVDYFSARGDRFAVSVRMESPLPAGSTPMTAEKFFESLRYAQAHGGRVVLRPETGAVQVRELLDAGLVPLACELPAGPKRPARPLKGISFNTGLGRAEAAGPAASSQPVTASSLLAGADNTLLLPLNVDPALASTATRGISAEVESLARLRGTIAGVVIPAWYPFQRMRDAVDEARAAGLPGTDLAAAPNWIKTDTAFVTGKNTQHFINMPGTISEKIEFDANFRRIGQSGPDNETEGAAATAVLLGSQQ